MGGTSLLLTSADSIDRVIDGEHTRDDASSLLLLTITLCAGEIHLGFKIPDYLHPPEACTRLKIEQAGKVHLLAGLGCPRRPSRQPPIRRG